MKSDIKKVQQINEEPNTDLSTIQIIFKHPQKFFYFSQLATASIFPRWSTV